MGVKLKHASGNGTVLGAPAANPSADITLKVPSTTGSAGQVLAVASANHSSTNAELEWAASGGLAEADQWRVNSNFSSADTVITSNWERVDDRGSAGPLGTGMSESSGVFTFPSTGYWLVTFMTFCAGTSANWTDAFILATTNNSAYNYVARTRESCEDGDSHTSICCQALMDVTSTTNVKMKFLVQAQASIEWYGHTQQSETSAVFLKLGAT